MYIANVGRKKHMELLKKVRRMFDQSSRAEIRKDTFFVYVKIPEDLQPIPRGEKYEDSLQVRLESLKFGRLTGGGSELGENHPDGTPSVEFCGLDIEVNTLPEGLAFLRNALVELGVPIGTQLHYTLGKQKLQDELHEAGWLEGQRRTFLHPGFGI
jgi:hypothetical protein